jgi:hypothetical protein
MHRRFVQLALVAGLSLAVAAPASAAETYHLRASGIGLSAGFTNVPDVGDEPLPPGAYFFTEVFAFRELAVGSEAYQSEYACVIHESFTVDADGLWAWTSGIFACGAFDTLSVDRRLMSGRLVASIPVVDCAAWDEGTGECLEPIELGNIDVDLTLTGTGHVQRYRSVSAGGTAGLETWVSHGTGARRDATPAGSIQFDGSSLIDGATRSAGALADASSGYVDIYVGG